MKKEKDQVPERGRKEKQNGQSKSKQGLSWKPYLNKVVERWKGRGGVAERSRGEAAAAHDAVEE